MASIPFLNHRGKEGKRQREYRAKDRKTQMGKTDGYEYVSVSVLRISLYTNRESADTEIERMCMSFSLNSNFWHLILDSAILNW